MAQVGMNAPGQDDTICAPATPNGTGGVSMVRVSGPKALQTAVAIGGKRLEDIASHSLRLATLRDKDGIIDQGVVSFYAAPNSYTGQEVVEYALHGSPYIVGRLLQALTAQGVRMAEPGEFTRRAFLNGKMDLSQAEAVADLIAGENKAMHDLAMRQLRGGFSNEIEVLRSKLLDFVALVELELDFGEEDVEFADHTKLQALLDEIERKVTALRASFKAGNAIKAGIPVAIVGKPNAGKSTLMNALLHEERALVSDIPGTTRDTIEEVWHIDGLKFRFIDTAGLRQSGDVVEKMGIERTMDKMRQAQIWLYLFDAENGSLVEAREEVEAWKRRLWPEDAGGSGDEAEKIPVLKVIFVANKVDAVGREAGREGDTVYLSARERQGMDALEDALREMIPEMPSADAVVLINARHYEALGLVRADLQKIRSGLQASIPGDLLAMDIWSAIEHLGAITGKILADDVLGAVFSRFCIGK
ncbi:MAG: tRNA uridine-5-carboxymethylaminomethyl(34) synthesis GTPase MnmE [Bacteroides sp.]|nr:tRNA uridine-5-carboxymethylaminomethyl(34) synthesis GTPase MnmE [Ruminococcus flavefaciens]MCM1554657.1 tRNA uridine-5-carboxymethylaminomethyl(34) synthesis GTPase MnmE [Bacteroides sp.]